jgi:hypothetical protein
VLCRLFAAHVDGSEDGQDVGSLGPLVDVGQYTSIFRAETVAEVFAFLQPAGGKIDCHIQRSAKKSRPEPACDGLELICGPEEININRRNSESGSFSGALKKHHELQRCRGEHHHEVRSPATRVQPIPVRARSSTSAIERI